MKTQLSFPKIPAVIFLLLASFTCAYSQITFQKTFDAITSETGYSVEPTADGGYILAGWTGDTVNWKFDVYLIKTDANGVKQWTKTYGGSDSDYGIYATQTSDGGYIIAGYTWSFGAGNTDAYIIKTDGSGVMQWSKTIGGSSSDFSMFVQETSGGYIVTGYTNSFGAGGTDVYLFKLDASGSLLWSKTFGGSGADYSFCVRNTSDGGFVLTGRTSSFGVMVQDVYVIKTNASGDTTWTRTYGALGTDKGISIEQTTDGGYIIGGWSDSYDTSGYDDFYLVKIDSNGTLQWANTYGGSSDDGANSVQQTSDGGYLLGGFSYSYGSGPFDGDIFTVKTDSLGAVEWSKTYGDTMTEDQGYAIQTSDGGYIIAGSTYSFGYGNAYVIKTDAGGVSGCNEFVQNPNFLPGVFTVFGSGGTISTGGTLGTPATVETNQTTTETTLCSTVGITENYFQQFILIYPNPVTDVLKIKINVHKNTKVSIRIYDVLGNLVEEEKENSLREDFYSIKMSSHPAGMYFVKVQTDNSIITKKIVVMK